MKIKKYEFESNDYLEILTAKDVKEILGCGINRAYELMKSPAFPSTKIGGRYIVTAAAMKKWLATYENQLFCI